MAYPIGIDLGTTNSVVCVWRRGIIETVPVDGRNLLPSAVSVRPDGSVLVGQPAKASVMMDPEHSITSVKRVIGAEEVRWNLNGRVYTPVDISALILGRLKVAAEKYLRDTVREAVITVPAYFNNRQKQATKQAAEMAGLKALRLLPEPTAAAISYGMDKGKDQTLLVYDLGGGTFDVSVLRVTGNSFRVIAVDGDFHLGGDDFDLALTDFLIERLKARTRADLGLLRRLLRGKREPGSPQELLLARARLKEAAEKAKVELAESNTAHILVPEVLGTSLDEEVTLTTYNRLIAPFVKRTVDKIHAVLRAARQSTDDIDRVILVGGSTRNRLVREEVARVVKEPWISDRVDEAVAQGAAIVAGYLTLPEEDALPIELTNVTPFNLGVRATKGKDTDRFQVLIPRNTPVPHETSHEFTTLRNNQSSVEIAVFQGEAEHCTENTFIGGFQLMGIPPGRAGEPQVGVHFSMDDSDLLAVSATCSHLRSEKTLDVNMVSREEDLPTAGSSANADIIFLIDTSGSMTGELEGVKSSCLTFAQRVMDAGIGVRLGLVDFDKPWSSNYNWEIFGPMEPNAFPQAIAGLRIGRLGGCGCYIGEANTVPVIRAFIDAFPGDRSKIGILISDEVGNDATVVKQISQLLKSAEVCLHVVGVRGSCHEILAKESGGRFWDINASRGRVDFSELLGAIAEEITNLALR